MCALAVLHHNLLQDGGTLALDVDKVPWSTMKKSAPPKCKGIQERNHLPLKYYV
jgi:hypothetical protein